MAFTSDHGERFGDLSRIPPNKVFVLIAFVISRVAPKWDVV